MKKYLAYGSNMDERQMAHRCPDAKLLGAGVLDGWRLMFKGEEPNSYATIEQWDGFRVPYVLWEISRADEKSLNRYEGFPRHYLKRSVTFEFNGEKVTAMFYAKPETQAVAPPSLHYVDVIWQAYERFGLDLEILQDAVDFSCGDLQRRRL